MVRSFLLKAGTPRERVILAVWWFGLGALLLRGNAVLENWATLFFALWSGFLVILLLVLIKEGPLRLPGAIGWPLVGIVAAAAISAATTIHPDASLREFARLASLGALVLALTTLFRAPHRWRWAAQSLLALVAVIIVGSLVAHVREGLPSADHQLRGPFFWHNQMGSFLAVTLPLFLGSLATARTARTLWIGAGLMIVTLVGLLLTFSRGSWLTALLALPLASFALRPPKKRIFALLAASIVAGAILAARTPALLGQVTARTTSLFSEVATGSRTTSGNIRADAVWVARQTVRERFLFGTGPGTFADDFLRFQRAPWRYAAHAHSEPLEMLAELGIAGGTFFALFLLAVAGTALRALRQARRGDSTDPDRVLLGAIAVSVLAFLFRFLIDVDWSFMGLQALFASLLALLIALDPDKTRSAVERSLLRIPNRVSGTLAAIPLALAAFVGVEELHTRQLTAKLAVNDLAGAGHAADRLLAANPWSGTGNLLRGSIAFLQQDLDRAEAAYRRAATLLPFRSEPVMALGNIHAWKGDRARAEEAYREALRLAPYFSPLPALEIERLRRQAGDLKGAEQALREAVERRFPLNDDLAALYYFLRYTPAGERLPALYRALLRVYETQGNTAEADALRARWALFPDLPPL